MAFGHDGSGHVRRSLPVLGALTSSAVLFYLGYGIAVVPLPLLGFLAPLPVLLLAPRVSARVAVGVAFLALFLATSNSWMFFTHSTDLPLPFGMAICVTLSLIFALATWVFRGLLRRGRALLAAVAAPAIWAGLFYVVQISNPMGVAGNLASSQADAPVVLQIARVTGAWGVDFLVVFVPAAVAVLCAPGVAAATRWRIGAVGAAALATTLGYGVVQLADTDGSGPTQRLAMVVHNRAGWGVDIGTAEGQQLARSYVEQVAALPEGVDTVVMPEGAFAATDQTMPSLTQPMRQAARNHGVTIVVGLTHSADGEKYQKALTFPASGAEPLEYLKHRDMVSPPSEELTFLPGDDPSTGIAICNDLTATNPSRDYGAAGAELMVMPASTEGENGWQMSRTGMLRGIENGFAVGWASRAGSLTIADNHGRVHGDATSDWAADPGVSGAPDDFVTVTADVPTEEYTTIYTRLGDWFVWLCLALAGAGVLGMLPWKRQHTSAPVTAPAETPGRQAASR